MGENGTTPTTSDMGWKDSVSEYPAVFVFDRTVPRFQRATEPDQATRSQLQMAARSVFRPLEGTWAGFGHPKNFSKVKKYLAYMSTHAPGPEISAAAGTLSVFVAP